MRFLVVLAVPLASLLASACSSDSGNQFEAHFDRPVDMAFACIDIERARPLTDCSGKTTADAGPDDLVPRTIGMAIQETTGDVVIARLDNSTVIDSDPLTPGFNGVAVGSRPIGGDTTVDGCYVVVANSGSCDLAAIDARKAAAPLIITQGTGDFERDIVTRQPVLNTAGQTLAAAPERIAVGGRASGSDTCPATPEGIAYLSYPRCHKVVAVDLASKTVVSSIDFSTGVPVVGDGNVTCPIDCSDVADPAEAAPGNGATPGTLVLEPKGGRLYIGARDLSSLAVVELSSEGTFTAVQEVPLEGAGGLLRLAASGDVTMGADGQMGVHRFVYAITTEASIRVIEVTPDRTPVECDTQIDPRYARSTTDLSRLPCFAVGGAGNPPRRESARGPGIRLPGDATPFDLGFFSRAQVPSETQMADPPQSLLNGTFVAVTGRNSGQRGVAYLVVVDDDNYPDFESSGDPLLVDVGRSMPHQLRDGVDARRHPAPLNCLSDTVLDERTSGPVRMQRTAFNSNFGLYNSTLQLPEGTYVEGTEIPVPVPEDTDPSDEIPALATRLLPLPHLAVCTPMKQVGNDIVVDEDEDPRRVPAMSVQQPDKLYRERSFPDLQRTRTEDWRIQWEGRLAYAGDDQIHPGGVFAPVPGELAMTLSDESAPFCTMGVEEGDTIKLTGCTQEFQCGVDESCYFHPDAPAQLGGVCLPDDRVNELASICRPLLISNREFLIQRGAPMKADQLTLVPRPTVLASSPPDGCVDNEQCRKLFEDEVFRKTREPATADNPRTWVCRKDQFLTGGPRCTATCPDNRDEECPLGSVCQDKVCVEGGFVEAQCFGALQQYEVHATEAFTVLGSQTGYLHNRLLDIDTGECITDPTPDPLRVGRFHAIEPTCDLDDPIQPIGANPCSLVLDEPVYYEFEKETPNGPVIDNALGTRKSRGIRFRNFAMRLELADVIVPQSDPGLAGVLQAAYPRNFVFGFEVGAGFASLVEDLSDGQSYTFTVFPGRVRTAPSQQVWVVEMGDADSVRHGALIGFDDQGTLVLQ